MTRASPVRMEGLTLPVKDVRRSIAFYGTKLGFKVEMRALPHFALIRVGGADGGTIGLLSMTAAAPAGAKPLTRKQRGAFHVELSTDDLDGLYAKLKSRGVRFHEPPHDEPWERAMSAYDPDGHTVEFAQGRRGRNKPRAKR